VAALAEQHGFETGWDIPANMQRFLEGQIDTLYRVWLATGDIGVAHRPHRDLGWLFQERAAIEAEILHRTA
jgi:hypothetical protein